MFSEHVFKRAAEEAANTVMYTTEIIVVEEPDMDQRPVVQVPPAFFIALFLTTVVMLLAWVPIAYCLDQVLATLTMIETPTSSIALADSQTQPLTKAVDSSNADAPELDPLPAMEHSSKPVTSSIRGAIRHITSRAGPYARWRGFHIFLLYSFLGGIAKSLSNFGFSGNIFYVVGICCLCPIHVALTHAVIAAPGSNKVLRQRVGPLTSYVYLGLPTLMLGTAYWFSNLLQWVLQRTLLRVDSDVSPTSAVTRMFSAIGIIFAYNALIILPCKVALTRVEASLLPEDEDAIVPFDRTFGGRAVSKEQGGWGALGYVDAFRTIDREMLTRLVKLYVKIFAITVVFVTVFTLVLSGVAAAFMDHEQIRHVAQKGIEKVSDLKVKM